jgi:5-methylthioadenosine/S-adenosylhomocysteine deaminase
MPSSDILIKNAYILCFDAQMSTFERGSLAINGNTIVAVGNSAEMQDWQAAEVLDGTGMILMPGFVNGHTHAGMSFFKGMADDMPVIQWLQEKIWPAEGKFLSPQFVYDAVLHAAAEMIKNGITCFNDMYFYSAEAAQACTRIGIRAVLGEGILNFPVANHNQADDAIQYAVQLQKEQANELVQFAIAPHAVYTCNQQNLLKSLEAATANNMPLHLHVAETQGDDDFCRKEYQQSPIEFLDAIGLLSDKVVIAHGIWLTDKEMEILAKRGVTIAVNTNSNLKLASGIAPLKRFEEIGVRFCLGTDGVASNNRLDMLSEISTTAKLHKAINNDATFLPARRILQIAINNGTSAVHLNHLTGSIEAGKEADLIMLDMNNLTCQPLYDPYSHLVYAATSEQIQHVMIRGKWVLKNRILTTIDENELVAAAKEYQHKIM